MFFTRNALGASYDTEWWKHTDIYELDVGGFKDHDGDGFGDLQGKRSYKYSSPFNTCYIHMIHMLIN